MGIREEGTSMGSRIPERRGLGAQGGKDAFESYRS
jgi:hypothetical protein